MPNKRSPKTASRKPRVIKTIVKTVFTKSRKPKAKSRKVSKKPIKKSVKKVSKKPVKKSVKKVSKKKSNKRVSTKKPRKPANKKINPKYERCVLAVKSKQPKKCFKKEKWVGGKKCVNPWAVCTSKVGRYL